MKETSSVANRITESLGWELLKIALVPIALTVFGALLNQYITQRERMQNYLTSTTEMAAKTDSLGRTVQIKNSPVLRSLIRARTLLILAESNGREKRQVMEFLANADLHYQISLANADLRNADLSGMYLKHVDLKNADLSGSKLDRARLLGANLFGIQTDQKTSLKDLVVDRCTIPFKDKLPSVAKKPIDPANSSDSEPCRYDASGNRVKPI
jgi:hypothetical protein